MKVTTLHGRVTRAAELRPDAAALVHPDGTMTYEALERLGNRMARALLAAGCERGDRVAFLLPRTPMTVAIVVGILKAGCVYVPLDLRSPPARLRKVVERCEPKVILFAPATKAWLEGLIREGAVDERSRVGWMGREKGSGPIIAKEAKELEIISRIVERPAFTLADVEGLPADPVPSRGGSGDPAYILFTSGSTGTPKGVVITHRNVTTFIDWAIDYFGLGPLDRLGGYTELTFDLSTFDLHATFAAGAELHMVPEELKLLPPRIVESIRTAKLTHWLSVPSFLEYAARFDSLERDDLPAMKWVTWCGDVLSTPALSYWMERLPGASFANLYGPTETTVASSCYRVPAVPSGPAVSVPIGRGCGGEELLILDEHLRPVPTGEVGELFIRGAGLSPGYWRDQERTEEVYLPDPSSDDPVARIYRTGDLAREDREGNVHFLGRWDRQIKTRGFRVELGEVEAALNSVPGIERCVVVGFTANETPGKLIGCAYVPDNGGPVPPQRIEEELRGMLPNYMVPARWLELDQLPLNDRGKVDRSTIQTRMEET